MPQNRAAWLTGKQVRPLEVSDAPMPELKPGHVIIENKAIGINPVDAMIQSAGIIMKDFPVIMGLDGAGIVHSVADDVKQFKPGDRVLGYTHGDALSGTQRGSFQAYYFAEAQSVAILPPHIPFTDGAVLPSCLGIAADSMFDPRCLGLDLPPVKGVAPSNGKVVIIWAGASVVGSCAIQLATQAGYEVFATASAHNFDYLRSIGASQVFDYKDTDVISKMVSALDKTGKPTVGAYGAYLATHMQCAELLKELQKLPSASKHSNKVATVMPDGYGFSIPEGWPEGIECLFVNTKNEELEWIFREWLPGALEDGRMKCKPEAEVVGKGLEHVQEGMDRWSKGVSAKKIVVEL